MSIVVTNYNYGHYLDACLKSLRAQTSAPDEIFVVNDGSTDGSAEILHGLTDVTVIDQANGGQAAAFNAGFAATQGDILIFVDADDKLQPQAVEVIRRLWSSDISALSYGLNIIDVQGLGSGSMRWIFQKQTCGAVYLASLQSPLCPQVVMHFLAKRSNGLSRCQPSDGASAPTRS